MKKRKGFTLIELMRVVCLVLAVFAVIGYAKNIVKLCHYDFEKPYKAEIIRGIGIAVPPAGVIMGYIEINDGKVQEKEEGE